jgi:predicted metal-binding protein
MTLGEWCDENGEYGDKLVEEWYDPDRTVDGVTRGTDYRALWRCSAGCMKDGEPFTWEAAVNSRTGPRRQGCPGCAGRVPTDAHNLRKWCEDNGEYGQKLIEEWAEPDADMKDVTPASNKKLSWRCSAGCTVDGEPFTWEVRVDSRTCTKRCGCPGCGGHGRYARLTDQNNLLKWCQDNGEWGQKLIEEWAEPGVDMKDVLHAINKKLLWRCSAGCTVDGEPFTWEAMVGQRTSSKRHGCPGCSPKAPIDLRKRLGKIVR